MHLNPSQADTAIYFLERVAPRSMKDQELLAAIIDVLKKGYRHDVFSHVSTVHQNLAYPSPHI